MAPMRYDLLITDQTMPGMTGVELAQHLSDIRPELPIILCTGFSKDIDGLQIEQLGICSVLQKPVRESRLISEIESHCLQVQSKISKHNK